MPAKKHSKRPLLIPDVVDEEPKSHGSDHSESEDDDSPPSPKNVVTKREQSLHDADRKGRGHEINVPTFDNYLDRAPPTAVTSGNGVHDLTVLVVALTKAGAQLKGKVNNDGRFELDFTVNPQAGRRQREANDDIYHHPQGTMARRRSFF